MKVNILLLVLLVALGSCGEDAYTPKPKGYFRITLPQRNYVDYNGDCPFKFQSPSYAAVVVRPDDQEPCWFNIEYPFCNATLHCSYKSVGENLEKLITDSRTLTQKHIVKATDIKESRVNNSPEKVFGIISEIKGSVASPMQFYITDSTTHFLRASLYFNSPPNPDSLAPVVEFITADVAHMIESFRWKKDGSSLDPK